MNAARGRPSTCRETGARGRGARSSRKLRGWLHAGDVPAGAWPPGIVLVALSPTRHDPGRRPPSSRHRRCCSSGSRRSTTAGTGRRGRTAFLRRLDHSNIFLLIAGTYTPFACCCSSGRRAACCSAWSGAAPCSGIAFRVFWIGAPALALPAGLRRARLGRGLLRRRPRPHAGGPAVFTLIAVGGGLYTLGGAGLRASSGPTRARAGSASTRCSTCSPSRPSSALRRGVDRDVPAALRRRDELEHVLRCPA